MKIMSLLAWAALPMFIMGGCTTTTGGSSALQRDVETLKIEVADLKDNSRVADMRGGGNTAGEVGKLRTDVNRLSGNVDQVNSRLERLERQAGLPTQPSSVSGVNPPYQQSTQSTPPAAAYQGATSDPYADGTAATTSAAAGPASSPALPPPAGPYEDGKTAFDRKNYREAEAQFKSYLNAEPKGANAAAAQFYIGESLYAQQKYEEAILEYQKVIQGFPKSTQVATSLLKQGISFQSIGDKGSAKLLYQKVVSDYPKSYAAGVAKERLKSI